MSYDREQYLADIKAKRWCQFVPKHERPVLSKLIKLGLEGGNVATINDGEAFVVKDSADQALLRSRLGHAEEDVIHFHNAGDHLGWFYLIYNNGSEGDPMIVISDYSGNEFCDEIWKKLRDQYDA